MANKPGAPAYKTFSVEGGGVVTASRTSYDLTTSLPSWVRRFTICFNDVSLATNVAILIQLGDSGGVETSGYSSGSSFLHDTTVAGTITSTAGFVIAVGGGAQSIQGTVELICPDASNNRWYANGVLFSTGTTLCVNTAGVKATSAAVTTIRVTNDGSPDAFDGGAINWIYSA